MPVRPPSATAGDGRWVSSQASQPMPPTTMMVTMLQGISTTADTARDQMAKSIIGGAESVPGLTRFGG